MSQKNYLIIVPFLVVSWDPAKWNLTGEELAEQLGRTTPRIAVGSGGKNRNEPGATHQH